MDIALIVLQLVVALGIVNVWLLRTDRSSPYRGGGADTMEEEFANYGLSPTVMRIVGGLKLTFAAMLVVGIWVPALVLPAAIGLSLLMLGAVAMHVKIQDAFERSIPALTMLVMCVSVALLAG